VLHICRNAYLVRNGLPPLDKFILEQLAI